MIPTSARIESFSAETARGEVPLATIEGEVLLCVKLELLWKNASW